MLQMLLPMLLGMGGSMAGRALLSRLMPALVAKGIPGASHAPMVGDALGSLMGYLGGEAITSDPTQTEGNGPAFSRYQAELSKPASPVSVNYAEMLQEMGIDPRSL